VSTTTPTRPAPAADGALPEGDPRPQPTPPRRRRASGGLPTEAAIAVAGVLLLLAVLVVCVSIGSVTVAPADTLRVVGDHLGLGGAVASPIDDQIGWELRVPRVLAAALVGAALALAGAALQVTVRNALADPQVLGASAGASTGAVLALTVLGATGVAWLSIGAFAGAAAALALVLLLGAGWQGMDAPRLVLAGVAVAAFFTAITSWLQFRADPDRLQAIVFWLMGSLAGVRWDALAWLAPVVLVVGVVIVAQAPRLDALAQGDVAATSLGVDPVRLRVLLVVCTALLTGAAIAVAGGIGFVGLVIPHVVRMLRGGSHRRTLVPTALLGAIYLPLMDLLSRTVQAPEELPIGVLTALVGCPFFVLLLRRRRVGGLG
jgi:iron complex transport system permease protein